MTKDEFKNLAPGDIVTHVGGGGPYIVHSNYGKRVTAVKTADLTNPSEWKLVVKVKVDERHK